MFKPSNQPSNDYTSGKVFFAPYWPSLVSSGNSAGEWVKAFNSSISSVKTPGFRTKPRKELQWNNFSLWNRSIYYPQDMIYCSSLGYYYSGACFRPASSTLVDGSFRNKTLTPASDADVNARSEILSKLRSSSVNLAQAYAERKQTSSMLAKTVNRLAQGVRAIRKGNLKHASTLFAIDKKRLSHLQKTDLKSYKEALAYNKKIKSGPFVTEVIPTPSNLSNYWLEYSYGWRPLLSDIYGSCQLLAKTFNPTNRHRVSSVSSFSTLQKDYIRFEGPGTYSTTDIQCKGTFAKSATVRYVIEFVEDSASIARLSSTGITDPLLLAWELLPYSFVLDWFLPVGDYLSNLNATRGLYFVRGSKSTLMKDEFSGTFSTKRHNGRNYAIGGNYRETYESKGRIILANFPAPALLSPRLPGSLQAVSGLALIHQFFRK